MKLNDHDYWRPITFQGVTFPATLMGIDILMHLTDDDSDDGLNAWLFRLTVCRGVTKNAPAERCARCAQQTIDLMLEHRQRVHDEIRDCLAPHGFEVEATYRDWMLALQRIVEISTATEGDCSWSAPLIKGTHGKPPTKMRKPFCTTWNYSETSWQKRSAKNENKATTRKLVMAGDNRQGGLGE